MSTNQAEGCPAPDEQNPEIPKAGIADMPYQPQYAAVAAVPADHASGEAMPASPACCLCSSITGHAAGLPGRRRRGNLLFDNESRRTRPTGILKSKTGITCWRQKQE